MMLDADVVAVSPSSVYRVLRDAGLMKAHNSKPSLKGKGFEQPFRPHEHWHVDITYINVAGTFFYLCSLLDGCSRFIVHWEIRESMTEAEVETIIQRARERFPDARPRIISDNGPQFIAKDFKEFIRICGMTHVRTSPYYPQSNGKMERWYKTLKGECIRVKTPLSLEDARRLVAEFVAHYNTSVCTARSATSRPRTSWPAGPRRSSPSDGSRHWRRRRRPRRAKAERRGDCTVVELAGYDEETRAEDRAPRGHDPSADQGPRPERAARCRPTAFRDWPESDKSIHSLCSQFTSLTSDAAFPIYAEPIHHFLPQE